MKLDPGETIRPSTRNGPRPANLKSRTGTSLPSLPGWLVGPPSSARGRRQPPTVTSHWKRSPSIPPLFPLLPDPERPPHIYPAIPHHLLPFSPLLSHKIAARMLRNSSPEFVMAAVIRAWFRWRQGTGPPTIGTPLITVPVRISLTYFPPFLPKRNDDLDVTWKIPTPGAPPAAFLASLWKPSSTQTLHADSPWSSAPRPNIAVEHNPPERRRRSTPGHDLAGDDETLASTGEPPPDPFWSVRSRSNALDRFT
jgi:hypothetical protein